VGELTESITAIDWPVNDSDLITHKISAVAEKGDRFSTIDMGRKVEGCCAPFGGGGS